MIITPPAEVLAAVSADLKTKRLTQEEIAAKTGYKTRQAVSAILSSNKYMTKAQASKFSQAFGYNFDYLTSGIGSLMSQDMSPEDTTVVFPKMILYLRHFDDFDSFKEALNRLLDAALSTYGEGPVRQFLSTCIRYISFYWDCTTEDYKKLLRVHELPGKRPYSSLVDNGKIADTPEDYQKAASQAQEFLLKRLFNIYRGMQDSDTSTK